MGLRINIACGDSYLVNPYWLNLDYSPHSGAVKKANLLDKLPIESNSVEVIYSSHFFEHIPRDDVPTFVSECIRILKPGGMVRFVLPDFEELCTSYIKYRHDGVHQKADFLAIEILDQCVRQTPGGELGKFYKKLETLSESDEQLNQFLQQRNGHVIQSRVRSEGGPLVRLLKNPRKILAYLERKYIEVVVALLPSAFRKQNVSLAEVGERHAWLYDFYSIEKILKLNGFKEVQKLDANTTNIPEFPLNPLDVTEDGAPRKGLESMYIEAVKA